MIHLSSFPLLILSLLLINLCSDDPPQVFAQLLTSSNTTTTNPISSNNNNNNNNHTIIIPQTNSNLNQSQAVFSNSSSSNLTVPANANLSAASQNSSSSSILNQDEAIPLDTKITVPFSILGVILIVSGAPMAFWGGRNRWSSYFLTGAYLAALVVMIPILRFGVIEQDHHPSNAIQGVFVLACLVSAIAAGAVAVIFWKGTKFLVGAAGGFVISVFILSLKSNSLIPAPGLRWVFILICISIGFVLATIPILAIHVTLFATAAMGAAAVVLGIDCFTTGGLKEFWLFIVGFGSLWPKLTYYPFTVTMQAELGVMGGIFVMGAAVQWRLLEIIRKKINELKQLDQDRINQEDAAAYRQSMALDADLALWEKRHGDDGDSMTMTMAASPTKKYHCRKSSQFSLLPRAAASPMSPHVAYEEAPRDSQGHLPTLDVGSGLASSLGVTQGPSNSQPPTPHDHPNIETLDDPPKSATPFLRFTRQVSSDRLANRSAQPSPSPSRSVSIDFEKFENDRRVSRPPGAPSSWVSPLSTSKLVNPIHSPSSSPQAKTSPTQMNRPISYSTRPAELETEDAGFHYRPSVPLSTPGPRPTSEYLTLNLGRDFGEYNQVLESKLKGPSAKRHPEAPSRVIVGSYQPSPAPRSSLAQNRESKVLTIEELDQRHKQAMKKLQQPTTERVRDSVGNSPARQFKEEHERETAKLRNQMQQLSSDGRSKDNSDRRKSSYLPAGPSSTGRNGTQDIDRGYGHPPRERTQSSPLTSKFGQATEMVPPSPVQGPQRSSNIQKSGSGNNWLNY